MARNGSFTEEERRSDLSVRPTLGDKVRNASLGRGQAVLTRAAADASQLRLASLDPGRRAELLESFERLEYRVTCGTLLSCSSAHDPQGQQCTGPAVGVADLLVTGNRVV